MSKLGVKYNIIAHKGNENEIINLDLYTYNTIHIYPI